MVNLLGMQREIWDGRYNMSINYKLISVEVPHTARVRFSSRELRILRKEFVLDLGRMCWLGSVQYRLVLTYNGEIVWALPSHLVEVKCLKLSM